MGDNALILGHRLSEWCGHGPILEEDMALTNVSLDLIGQARFFYSYAAEIEGKNRSEDDLAYFRDVWQFKNVLLCEQPNKDFAYTIVRQYFIDIFHKLYFEQMLESSDDKLKHIAAKILKEVTYHVRHSSEWIVRLGDGTAESQSRVQNAVNDLWQFTGELFETNKAETTLAEKGETALASSLHLAWLSQVTETLKQATLDVPESGWMATGGRSGKHSEHLGYLLAELQYLQRSYPGMEW